MTRPFYRMMPKVASEGYCCIFGYLRLCRARGETKKSMSEWSGISFETLKNHYRRLKRGEHSCQKYSDCLLPVVEDIQRGPGDLGDDPNPPD
jgi:hypothetical protein